MPLLTTRLCAAADAGDLAAVRRHWQALLGLSTVLGRFGARAMKPLLNRLGLPGGSIRPPRLAIEGSALAAMEEAVRALALDELAFVAPDGAGGTGAER